MQFQFKNYLFYFLLILVSSPFFVLSQSKNEETLKEKLSKESKEEELSLRMLELLASKVDSWKLYNQELREKNPTSSFASETMLRGFSFLGGFTAASWDLLSSSYLAFLYYPILERLIQKEARKQKDLISIKRRYRLEFIARSFRALIFTPMAFFKADWVSRHFIPDLSHKKIFRPYGKYYQAKVFDIRYPKSISEVIAIVEEAKKAKKSISVVGAGFSQGGHSLPINKEHIQINFKFLKDISIDTEEKTAVVAAGVLWDEFKQEINKKKLSIKVMQASAGFSLVASLAGPNAHGWDYHTGTLAETVEELSLINADGKLLKVKPEDDLFQYVVGGYGNFGIVTDVKIKLCDNVKMYRQGELVNPFDYPHYFEKFLEDPDNSPDLHLYRMSLDPQNLLKTGFAENYYKIGAEALVTELKPEGENGSLLDRIAMMAARNRKYVKKIHWAKEQHNGLKRYESSRNEFMGYPLNFYAFDNSIADAEWLQEFFIPKDKFTEFLEFIRKKLIENDVNLLNATVRYVKQDKHSALKYATEDCFAFVLFFNQKLNKSEVLKTRKWCNEVYDYLITIKAKYYLPYQPLISRDKFLKIYSEEMIHKINRAKKKYDPDFIFSNVFLKKYVHERKK